MYVTEKKILNSKYLRMSLYLIVESDYNYFISNYIVQLNLPWSFDNSSLVQSHSGFDGSDITTNQTTVQISVHLGKVMDLSSPQNTQLEKHFFFLFKMCVKMRCLVTKEWSIYGLRYWSQEKLQQIILKSCKCQKKTNFMMHMLNFNTK